MKRISQTMEGRIQKITVGKPGPVRNLEDGVASKRVHARWPGNGSWELSRRSNYERTLNHADCCKNVLDKC